MNQYDKSIACYNMQRGREEERKRSKAVNLAGDVKLEGRKSYQERFPQLPGIIAGLLQRPFLARRLKRGGRVLTFSELSDRLYKRGIMTKKSGGEKRASPGGKPISTGRLREWLIHLDR